MNRCAITAAVLVMATLATQAQGQSFNARRMGMGGVVLPSGHSGNHAPNVAYRAVPISPGSSAHLPLPIGAIPLIVNPPVFDPEDPEFNAYELMNTFYNPPWNLQLKSSAAPSNDIVVSVGRDHLAVDLGDVAGVFPDQDSRLSGIMQFPVLAVGIGPAFAGLTAVAEYQNHLSLSPELFAALSEGQPFQPRTLYSATDNARGQVAAGLEFGWASSVWSRGDLARGQGVALYAGARGRVLRGLTYGGAHNQVAFATRDTLLSSSPIDLAYAGTVRQTGPGGGGWGHSLDLGAVWATPSFEAGLGINNLVSTLNWRVEESITGRDTVTNDFTRTVIADDVPFTSELPKLGIVNVAWRTGPWLLAGDVVRAQGRTTGHAGAELWLGMIAVRSGGYIDDNYSPQVTGGLGFKIRRIGVDLGVSTHSRNLTRERGVELGAGLSLYPGSK